MDIREKRIPDAVVLPAIALFVMKRAFDRSVSIPLTLLFGALGFGFFLLLYLLNAIYYFFRQELPAAVFQNLVSDPMPGTHAYKPG